MLQPNMRAGNAPLVAQEVIGRYHPQEVEVYDGYMNYVAIVDRRVVVKVPQDDSMMRLQSLYREGAALEALEEADLSPVAIPRLVELSTDPAYLVASYVSGNVLTLSDVRTMSRTARGRLGRSFGAFILHQAAVDPVKIQKSIPDLGEWSWHALLEKYVGGFSDSRYPTLSKVTDSLFAKWQAYSRGVDQAAFQCIHGDLTLENSTVTDDHSLHGVFDLARVHLGDVSEECSKLFDADEVLFEECMRELDKGGVAVDREHVRLWREMKDLHVLPYWILNNNLGHSAFIRWRDKITERYPHMDWSELY